MAKNKLPKNARFFIADDIRIESSQKTILLGFFPNDLIFIEMPENTNPSNETPVALTGISILASFTDFRGSFEMTMNIISPNNEILINNEPLGILENTNITSHVEANIVIRLSPFVVKQLGEYKLAIKILDKSYDYKFKFEKKIIS